MDAVAWKLQALMDSVAVALPKRRQRTRTKSKRLWRTAITTTVQKRVPNCSQEKVRTDQVEEYGGGASRYLQASQAVMQVLDIAINKRQYAHAGFTKPHRFKTDSRSIVASCDRGAFLTAFS